MLQRTRREFVGMSLAAPLAAIGLSAASRFSFAAELSGTTLRIATWGGSWRDSINKNVVSDLISSGVNVEYVLGNPEDNLAKLIAASRQGQVPFDAMEGFPHITNPMAKAGLIEKLNYDNLPNTKAAPKWARSEYEVVSVFTEDGVVYNVDKFKEAGIEPPTHYTDLTNPKLKGRVAFPDIGNAQHWNAVVGLAYESGGDEAHMDGAVKLVNEISPSYFFSASTELATRFGSGDIWAAPWHAGWASRLKRSGVPVSVGYTSFGDRRAAIWQVPDYVVTNSPNVAAAEAFINDLLAPENQFEHGRATGTIPVISQARIKLKDDPISKELLLLDDADLENIFQIDWNKLDEKAWRETWSREIHR